VKFAFYALFLAVLTLNAQIKSYEEIKDEPKSLAKDYYIHRLLTQTKYDKAQMKELRYEIYRNKGKVGKEMARIFGALPVQKKGCAKFSLLDANSSCLTTLLTQKIAQNLDKNALNKLVAKFGKSSEQIDLIYAMREKNPLEHLISTQNVSGFFKIYDTDKNAKFDINLSSEFASKLASYEKFGDFMQDLVINKKLPKLRASFAKIDATYARGEGAFWAGINALMHGKNDNAYALFYRAQQTLNKSPHRRDNAKFWTYLISKDEKILRELANSSHVNLYSLYAKETLGIRNLDLIIPQPSRENLAGYDNTDPFLWVKTKAKADKMSPSELRNFATKFDTKSTIGEWAYMQNIIGGYKDNIYAMPFMEYIGDGDTHRKALILAIARQESRFVPASVSISYALGMMQFMPFVANDIAKQYAIPNFDQDDMFNPQIAYKFANIHLDYLEKSLKSPVFIAYAYNGGLGFTRKTLRQEDLFKRGKFEPFLSMELVAYAESREYGKRVLGNFVVYSQILGENVSVRKLLDDLLVPQNSDFIR
jgi:transglycosylase SLT domain protein